MPSAAGIIMATGMMTLANEAFQNNQPLANAADNINWKVIPATAIAAGIFYGFEQLNSTIAKTVAGLAFFTAFVAPIANNDKSGQETSPLGTLLKMMNIQVKDQWGIPYSFIKGQGSVLSQQTPNSVQYSEQFAPYYAPQGPYTPTYN